MDGLLRQCPQQPLFHSAWLESVVLILSTHAGKPFRGPSMVAFGLTGFLAGYMLAAQKSYGRLTGEAPCIHYHHHLPPCLTTRCCPSSCPYVVGPLHQAIFPMIVK